MRFALLGGDAESLALVEAAVAAGHEIVWAGDAGDAAGSWPGQPDRGAKWEDLFDPGAADAVIAGRGPAPEELRARQVQELVKLGRPVLTVHPLFASVLTYFEIDMARGESGCVLEHYNPLTATPAVEALAGWIREGRPDIGEVEQVVATRSMADRSRGRVMWHFARDVELLDRIAGPLDRLGAHGAASGGEAQDADYAALSVQLSGKGRAPVRWVVEPPGTRAELVVTLVGSRGRLHAVFDEAGQRVELKSQLAGETATLDAWEHDTAAAVIARFAKDVDSARGASTWPAALRAMELGDTIEIALRRGRVIEVHHQELTEQLAFKGTMAALGCGVLVLAPVMVGAALVAGQLGAPVGRFVPHLLLGILGLFLALQLLPRLLYRKPPAAAQDVADQADG